MVPNWTEKTRADFIKYDVESYVVFCWEQTFSIGLLFFILYSTGKKPFLENETFEVTKELRDAVVKDGIFDASLFK